jgi:hypothetical protein
MRDLTPEQGERLYKVWKPVLKRMLSRRLHEIREQARREEVKGRLGKRIEGTDKEKPPTEGTGWRPTQEGGFFQRI